MKTKKFNSKSFNSYLARMEKKAEKEEKERKKQLVIQAEKEKSKIKKYVDLEKKQSAVVNSSFFDNLEKSVKSELNKPIKTENIVIIPYDNTIEDNSTKQEKAENNTTTVKTKLYYELPKKENVLYLVIASIEYNADKTIKHKTIIDRFPVRKINNFVSAIPSSVGIYMYGISLNLVYTALNTIYAKTADNKIFKLMRDLVHIWKYNTTTADNFELYTIAKNHCKELMTKKVHTYKMVKMKIAKSVVKNVKMEVIPYETLEFTKTGKEIIQEKQFQLTSDVNDLINVAVVAYCELYHLGIINSFQDVNSNRNYVYKRINSYIQGNKNNKEVNNDSINQIIENHGEKADFYTVSAENAYLHLNVDQSEKIDNDLVLQSFKDFLMENFKTSRKAQNKELIVNCWIQKKLYACTEKEIAFQYDILQQQVSRNIQYIDNFLLLENSDVIEWFNQFYDTGKKLAM